MIIDLFTSLNPVVQALLAGCFTWGLTAAGAATVYFTKDVDRKGLDGLLGFAGGVMMAASFWSLLLPAIELSAGGSLPPWIQVGIGFLLGGLFLRVIDSVIPHLHLGFPCERADGPESEQSTSTLLVLAVILHNIPEGLAIGVAFGAVASCCPSAPLAGAVALAIGIGIQNLPEGLAVSCAIRGEGISRWSSFLIGQFSGAVEPMMAVVGALLVLMIRPILPYSLAFAAGAMIYVIVEEVIPESQFHGNTDRATMGALLGFLTMMILDIGLG
jgi:ZIP family zinc transporter